MSSTLTQSPAVIPEKREITTKPRLSDRIFRVIVTSGGLSSLVILGLILIFLLFNGYDTLRSQGIHFLTSSNWDAVVSDSGKIDTHASHFGIAAMLIGTMLVAIIAVVVGVPISVGAAVYLTFYAPPSIKRIMVSAIDLMAAFPSVLFGLWGFFVLESTGEYWAKLLNKYFGWIPIFKLPAPYVTRSPFIAGLVLAIMIIPIVTSISREIFSQTPLDRIQAAYALGGTRFCNVACGCFPHMQGRESSVASCLD